MIQTLREADQRLDDLTAGQIDTVADRDGRSFLLHHAQDELRYAEAAKQAAILNALPAHIILLDTNGLIVSVNDAWHQLACRNGFLDAKYGIGVNYLAVCDAAGGDYALDAHRVATGIRAVLAGTVPRYSFEYPCQSHNEQLWFLLTVTPLNNDHPNGAVVMHVNITEQKRGEERSRRFGAERKVAENRIAYLNRVYSMLSGIHTLILRAHSRDELLEEACRIAVENGGFRLSTMSVLDRGLVVPIGLAGTDETLLAAVKDVLSAVNGVPTPMTARAITEKRAIVSNDSQSDPGVAFAKKHTEFGVRSVAIFPLLVANEVVGVFSLYANESQFFHEEEVKLLTELTNDVAFAIDHIEKKERLDYLACYDVLTGLANRTLFLERVAQHLRSVAGNGHKLALLLVDLQRFRNINDSLGRSAGDALLRQVAEWLTSNAGGTNLLARVGVDLFAVVLPDVGLDADLARFLEKTMRDFLDHSFVLDGAAFRISAKAGMAVFPEDGSDADTLFQHAEAALKKAKAGGDRYLFYTQKMTEAVAGKLTLENQLHQALDRDQFVLYYQPKVNLVSGLVTGAEALIRWNCPRVGVIPPAKFIPILEETGLIHEVGRWALRKAVEDYLRWRASGLVAVRVAVNVSALQLHDRNFVREIEQAIAIDPLAATGLELEITESVIMEDIKHNIGCLCAIRAMGVTIAVDDFGTGFSSLSYLAKLPVHTLKIDRSFVTDMTTGPEGRVLVSAIIKLAHSLKLNVVAEGVETEQQSRLLRLMKCDEIQGHLFGVPVSSHILEERYLARTLPVTALRRCAKS